MLIIILLLILFIFINKKESYKCIYNSYQNHKTIVPSNLNNDSEIKKIPRRDYIHRLHPYLFLVEKLSDIFPTDNPIIINNKNSNIIDIDYKNINITSKFIVKLLFPQE